MARVEPAPRLPAPRPGRGRRNVLAGARALRPPDGGVDGGGLHARVFFDVEPHDHVRHADAGVLGVRRLHLWIRALRTTNHAMLALAGALIALSALSKVFRNHAGFLLFLYAVLKQQRLTGWWLIYLAIRRRHPRRVSRDHPAPLRGRGLIPDAASFAAWARAESLRPADRRTTWIGLSFTRRLRGEPALLRPPALVARGDRARRPLRAALAGVVYSLTTFGAFRLHRRRRRARRAGAPSSVPGEWWGSPDRAGGARSSSPADADALLLSLWTLGDIRVPRSSSAGRPTADRCCHHRCPPAS